MPPGERRPRKSIRPVAVEVPLPEPEELEPVAASARYRVLISFEGYTSGEVHEIASTARTLALVDMGLLASVD